MSWRIGRRGAAADRAAQVAQVVQIAAGVQETTRPPLLVNMSPRSSALLIVEQIAPPSVHPSFIGAAARRVVVKLLAPVKPLVQAVRLAVSVQRVHVEQIAAQVVQIAAPVLIASRCACTSQ